MCVNNRRQDNRQNCVLAGTGFFNRRIVRMLLCAGGFLANFVFGPCVFAQSLTLLGDLPGGAFMSEALAISGDGKTVVGRSKSQTSQSYEAFYWTRADGMQPLGFLPGGLRSTEAVAISGNGSVIVGVGGTANGDEAFRWTKAGGYEPLGGLGEFTASMALGVSDDGLKVVGSSTDLPGGAGAKAFSWTAGNGIQAIAPIFGLSEATAVSTVGDIVVGWVQHPDHEHPIFQEWESVREGFFSPGEVLLEDGSALGQEIGLVGDHTDEDSRPQAYFSTQVNAISPDGKFLVGTTFVDIFFSAEATLWNGQNRHRLGNLPGGENWSIANDVSADGNTVVGYGHTSFQHPFTEAFIWTPNGGMESLKQVLLDAGANVADWSLLEAKAVSNDGRKIVGIGINPNGQYEAWLVDLDGGSGGVGCAAEFAMKQYHRLLKNPFGGFGTAASATNPATILDSMRHFRDNVLAHNQSGRRLTRLYYEHSDELCRVLANNPGIAIDLVSLLAESETLLQTDSRELVIEREVFHKGQVLLVRIARASGPRLQRAIREVRLLINRQSVQSATLVHLSFSDSTDSHSENATSQFSVSIERKKMLDGRARIDSGSDVRQRNWFAPGNIGLWPYWLVVKTIWRSLANFPFTLSIW